MKSIIKILAVMLIMFVSSCKKDDSTPSTNHISANDFLSDKQYKQLVLEINYVENFRPTDEAINNLKSFIQERLHKPNGIKVLLVQVPSLGKDLYTVTDAKNIEANHRRVYSSKNVVSAYYLFLDGSYYMDSNQGKTLGIAYGNSSVVMFEKTIHQFSGGITQPKREVLETTVMNHEFGHLLGLVNNGTPMYNQHQDTKHGHHCNNENCLMYYTAETSDVVANLVSNNIPKLDGNCLSDLKINGGK